MAGEPASSRVRALRLARPLALALLAVLASAAARAQTPSPAVVATDDGLTISLVSPWPSSANRGYAPVRVEVRNGSERSRELSLTLSSGWYLRSSQLSTGVTVAPGATERLELLHPLFGADLSNGMLQVGGDVEGRQHLRIAGVQADEAAFHVVVVTGDPDQVTSGKASPLVAAMASLCASFPAADATGRAIRVGGSSTPNPCVATYVAPRDLPLDPMAYTSLDGVIVDWESVSLDRDTLGALLAWVRLGGRAWILGAGPGVIDELPGVGEWDEKRFELEQGSGWRILRHGVGRLLLADGRQLLDPGRVATVVPFFVDASKSLPMAGSSDGTDWPAAARLRDIGAVTAKGGALALMLFVIVIGPVNLFVVGRRKKRPILLLVTTPILSLVASLLFLAYGVFRQGLDIKVASQSVTLLDQRSHRAVTIERRELFAGFVGGRGLRPAAGTCVSPFPPLVDESHYYGRRADRRDESFAVELGAERLLRGDFLPPREEARQLLYREAAARERLEIRRENGRLVAVNGFGVALRQVVVCDPEGKLHRAGGIEPGGAAPLEPLPATPGLRGNFAELWRDAAQALATDGPAPLPAGSYAAHLASSPFTDATGLELTHQNGRHAVVGILDLDGEEWR